MLKFFFYISAWPKFCSHSPVILCTKPNCHGNFGLAEILYLRLSLFSPVSHSLVCTVFMLFSLLLLSSLMIYVIVITTGSCSQRFTHDHRSLFPLSRSDTICSGFRQYHFFVYFSDVIAIKFLVIPLPSITIMFLFFLMLILYHGVTWYALAFAISLGLGLRLGLGLLLVARSGGPCGLPSATVQMPHLTTCDIINSRWKNTILNNTPNIFVYWPH